MVDKLSPLLVWKTQSKKRELIYELSHKNEDAYENVHEDDQGKVGPQEVHLCVTWTTESTR